MTQDLKRAGFSSREKACAFGSSLCAVWDKQWEAGADPGQTSRSKQGPRPQIRRHRTHVCKKQTQKASLNFPPQARTDKHQHRKELFARESVCCRAHTGFHSGVHGLWGSKHIKPNLEDMSGFPVLWKLGNLDRNSKLSLMCFQALSHRREHAEKAAVSLNCLQLESLHNSNEPKSTVLPLPGLPTESRRP